MRTSFHHQPEAQHPKSSAINKPAGRLPHLLALSGQTDRLCVCPLLGVKRTSRLGLSCPLMTQSGHRRIIRAIKSAAGPSLL